ncbi:hypothetical protein JRO89_XS12G0020500 [Xanthoceras sorbifolium]|uniref:Matrin-type domain-containing protein n=1 Tax=Xanthoceras sorbifolium TaxID=99658 RepID=A0ABQ8HAK3_9ROSI|nr:hypothetical protein JRO89_XS12G0020500 [Xanthoceras sorbifolium]
MDREWGSKPGSGGAASAQNEAIDRRERLRRLALETIDLAKDPYFMRNHLGSYECKLCLTLHNNEGNYLAHTQGKRHQTNLAKRAAREAKDAPAQPQPHKRKVSVRKTGNYFRFPLVTWLVDVKIGRPGYRVTKQFDGETKQRSLLFQIEYPEIEDLAKPRHRFMSSFEQRVQPFDKRFQYLLFAAEPYEIIAFKVPSTEIDKSTPKFFSHWDPDSKMFTVSFLILAPFFWLILFGETLSILFDCTIGLFIPPLVAPVCLKAIKLTRAVDKLNWLGPTFCSLAGVDTDLQLYFKTKPPETNKPQAAPAANGTTAPGVPPRPLTQAPPPPPPPPQGLPPGVPTGNNPSRVPPPPMSGSLPPPPPPMANGPRPMPPGGAPPAPPPPPGNSGTMANFTPGTQMGRPPMMPPPHGFMGQQMQGQGLRPPPPPPNMGQ